MAPGLPRPRPARRPLRRCVRERVALPRPIARATTRAGRPLVLAHATRRALRVEPPRLEPRGMAGRPLRRVARSRRLADPLHGRGLRRGPSLLSAAGTPAERAAVAGLSVAQAVAVMVRPGPGSDREHPDSARIEHHYRDQTLRPGLVDGVLALIDLV